MSDARIPLVILGGRDRRGSRLPRSGEGKHPLHGYKAVDLRIGDRPLISILEERLRTVQTFDPIYVAGPAAIYGKLELGLQIIDTDGDFSQNIAASLREVQELSPGTHIAFTTCDILPDKSELTILLEDYREHLPADFWMPQIRVPEDPALLGESAWKPQYTFRAADGSDDHFLPSHLVVIDPASLRVDLVLRLFELAYQTRNRPVDHRRKVMLKAIVSDLVLRDLKNLLHLRPPLLTWEVIRNGLALAKGLRDGDITSDEAAERVRRIFTTRSHRRAHPESRGRMPVLEGLSLALDIDTEEEAREIERQLVDRRAPSSGRDPGA